MRIGAWEQWSKAHPNNAGALAILGMLEESRGDKRKAEDYYKKALQIKPEQPVAANNLAYMMLQNGENVDVALSLAQTARRGMPNSPNSADTLAWAYYYKGTYGFARDLLEDAVKKTPNNASMQYHLGMVYSKMMDKNNAAIHLKKAISSGAGFANGQGCAGCAARTEIEAVILKRPAVTLQRRLSVLTVIRATTRRIFWEDMSTFLHDKYKDHRPEHRLVQP